MCNLRNKIPKQIPVMLQNWSYYEYNFSINELAKEFGITVITPRNIEILHLICVT